MIMMLMMMMITIIITINMGGICDSDCHYCDYSYILLWILLILLIFMTSPFFTGYIGYITHFPCPALRLRLLRPRRSVGGAAPLAPRRRRRRRLGRRQPRRGRRRRRCRGDEPRATEEVGGVDEGGALLVDQLWLYELVYIEPPVLVDS